MKFINHSSWPFTEQLLCNSCLHPVEVEISIYSTRCSFFRAACISVHTHKRQLTASLADTQFYLNAANTLPANSWKFRAARSGTPLTRVVCDKSHSFVFMHLFVSATEQVSCFTAKYVLTVSFPPSPVSASCKPASPKSYFGTAGR